MKKVKKVKKTRVRSTAEEAPRQVGLLKVKLTEHDLSEHEVGFESCREESESDDVEEGGYDQELDEQSEVVEEEVEAEEAEEAAEVEEEPEEEEEVEAGLPLTCVEL